MDIITILKDLYQTRDLQAWINNRYNDPKYSLVSNEQFKEIITKDNLKLTFDKNIVVWQNIWEEYWLDDIKPGEKVIDLGANIGVFSCIAAKRGANVTAVEPFTISQLKKTIHDNNFDSRVTIIPGAIGTGEVQKIEWMGDVKEVETKTLSQVKNISGGCDLLKCDIEGYEWYFDINDLVDIPKIEMELHKHNLDKNNNYLPVWYDELSETHKITFENLKICKSYDNSFGTIHARKVG